MMVNSDLARFAVVACGLLIVLVGLAVSWGSSVDLHVAIDPLVEKACFKELEHRAPLGHRLILTDDYHEEGTRLGIASGMMEAQYAPGQWTLVSWTCRINPKNREIARMELTPTKSGGGSRMRAAALAFK